MLAKWLMESLYPVILTGAGMSTESGLPDFRSAQKGLWKQKDPAQIASVEALNRNVDDFIEFYRNRVIGVAGRKPHKGHEILAKWERKGLIRSIITQNVDGFHQEAGSNRVIELHGTLREVHCQSCGMSSPSTEFFLKNHTCTCGGVLRPSVVLFGEMLPEKAFVMAADEAEKADLFIVLGSSLTVTPANRFPLMAKQNGARFVIVNMEPTEFDSYADLVVNGQQIGPFLEETNRRLDKIK